MRHWLCFLALIVSVSARAQTTALIPQSSQAVEGTHVFCTAQCKLFTLSIATGSSSGFLMIFDSPSVPADGALTNPPKGAAQGAPKYCWPYPANTGQSYSWGSLGSPWGGAQFTTGLVVVFSTGADCLHKAASNTAFFTAQYQ